MDPAVALLCLEQRDRSLESHTRDFLELACLTHFPNCSLCVFYISSLSKRSRARLPGSGPRKDFAAFVEWVLVSNNSPFTVSPAEDDFATSPTPLAEASQPPPTNVATEMFHVPTADRGGEPAAMDEPGLRTRSDGTIAPEHTSQQVLYEESGWYHTGITAFQNYKECVQQLNLSRLVSVSMDGPNVNLKFFELLQSDLNEMYGGAQLVSVGSCGLHTLHNAFKAGFSMWQVEKLLRAMHILFNNVPARREDYVTVTNSSVFPLSFCGHRWLENLPVVERALEVWPSLQLYVDAVKRKELPNPGTGSYDTIEATQKDPLILAKLDFFATNARTFDPFLKRYQTDEPGDVILQQFEALLTLECRNEEFLSFQPMVKRLDTFLCGCLSRAYPVAWAFCQKLLLLSHGQASVERGFSVNKEVETDNMQEETMIAHRLVCDYVDLHGGVTKVPLTKELLVSVGAARSRYRIFLDQQRARKESEAGTQKRKLAEEYLTDLKRKKTTVQEVSTCLAREADMLAEEAEGKSGSKMAQLLSKSNALRWASKEKLAELKKG
ncbi:hypothetical protein DPX16_21537 [Anabarilius grahami]|uniref:Uncharacterized protein n=1 Tax=Anabarilius grahami TaxID=495550 RepID=A0A3N0XWP9_ANAGA|nr:hypothetical protein DPX16_21537 [Anabarilius grahami]